MGQIVFKHLYNFFSDPWVIIAWIVAIAIAADLGTRMRDERPYLPAVDWAFHQSCVELAHGIIDYGAYPIQSYWDAGCPAGTFDGVICGYINDAECRRLLREWGR